MLVKPDGFGLQIGFACFQATPARVAKKPKSLVWQFPVGRARRRLT
jgi:hypothetical protein